MRILLLLMIAAMAPAQSLNDARMARGDDPRWADPAFDDRAWEIVRHRRIRPMQDAQRNRLWLRLRVAIPVAEPSAVLAEKCACELFLDGIRLGGTADLNAPRPSTTGELTVFPVPALLAGRPAVLAIRVYQPPGYEAALGPAGRCQIRLAPVADVGREVVRLRDTLLSPYLFRLLVLLLALGLLLASATGQRRDPLILGMLGYVLPQVVTTMLIVYAPLNLYDNAAWLWLAAAPVQLSLLFVQWHLAELPIRRFWAVAVAALLLIRVPWAAGLFLAEPAPWTPLAASLFMVPDFGALGLALYAAVRGWRRSPWPVRFLAVALVSVLLFNLLARLTGQGWISGLALGQGDALAALVLTVLVTAHVLRTSRERRAEEQRLRTEMESAQTVQTLLLSQAMPAGVDAVYLPAGEVGGDFYQAFTTPDGTLVVAGDVSGKGLQAAMRVSAIIGALRNRRSGEPAAVLQELNRVLLGGGGFTTCCCALFPLDSGPARVANAGHPAPFADGVELELEPALPLGVVAEASYAETAVSGSVFTFVSDGVLEAENAARELFGFDRTRAISTRPAAAIAEAARAWGQNDDITVVTVRRKS